MHEGHRQRMIERLREDGVLQDHELLEILLFNAIPRKNTNPIAHELIRTFGTLRAVMDADLEALARVQGVGRETAAYLRCIGLIGERIFQTGETMPRMFNANAFSEFLEGRMSALTAEVIEIFCIDAEERIFLAQQFAAGEENMASVAPEEIGHFLALNTPVGIVAAHNHPAVPAVPSESDDRFTAQLNLLCALNHVQLYDHIIVGRGGTFSYFREGRLEGIRRRYSMNKFLGGKA